MKIAIVGAGAMGSLFGGLLADAGHNVWLYDICEAHVQAVSRNGLMIEYGADTRRIRLNAVIEADKIGPSELVLVFVKSTQTESAAGTASRLAAENGLVLTLQNGMGNAEVISKSVLRGRILAGTTAQGATTLGAGRIRHVGKGPTVIGMWSGDADRQKTARKIAAMLTRAGIETTAVAEVLPVIWDKLLVNVGINAVTALTGIKNGQILELDSTRELIRTAVEEAASVARAKGIQIRNDPVGHVFQVAAATRDNRSSMGQDVDHCRPTEIAAINGFVAREAERMGIAAPVNRALTALVETLEGHY